MAKKKSSIMVNLSQKDSLRSGPIDESTLKEIERLSQDPKWIAFITASQANDKGKGRVG